MSSAAQAQAQAQAAGGTRRERARRELTPLVALLRRDLLAGSRGGGMLVVRFVTITVTGLIALLALKEGRWGMGPQLAGVAVAAIFMVLLCLGFALAPAFAVASLRREREAGMLDLLLLAGIRPSLLAVGRTLSTFLLLQTILFAALPAVALFWYFRRPSAGELALATIGLSFHFLALAAVVVAISAWARHAGSAIALTAMVVMTWAGVLIAGVEWGWPVVSHVLTAVLSPDVRSFAGGKPLGGMHHVLSWSIDAVAAGAALAATVAGLGRRVTAVTRDVLRERIERKPLRLDSGWALTWLLQRRSAPARPRIQAVLVAPLVLGFSTVPPEATLVLAAMLVTAGACAALALGATAIAPERERRTWTCLVATGLSGRRILADLLRGTLLGSAVPVFGGLVLYVSGLLRGGAGTWSASSLATSVALVVVGWTALAAAGLAASLVTSRTSAALALGAGLALGEPLLATISTSIVRELGSGHVEGALLVALVILAAGALAGAVLLFRGLRRGHGVQAISGIVLVLGCVIVPALLGGASEEAWMHGGQAIVAWPFDTALGEGDRGTAGPGLGILHHLIVTASLALALLPRLDAWLGRAP